MPIDRDAGGLSHGGRLYSGATRAGALDGAVVGGAGGRVGRCAVDGTRDRASSTQKNALNPWPHKPGGLPEVSGEFVAALAEVLALYAQPYAPTRPTVTFDETTKQWIRETRRPRPACPGHGARYEYDYNRKGTRNLFLVCAPQAGGRHVEVTAQRPRPDFARQMKGLDAEQYPEAAGMRVGVDNLNPHNPGARSETVAPAAAHRWCQQWAFHYPPKPGRWLNMAELELRVLAQIGRAHV